MHNDDFLLFHPNSYTSQCFTKSVAGKMSLQHSFLSVVTYVIEHKLLYIKCFNGHARGCGSCFRLLSVFALASLATCVFFLVTWLFFGRSRVERLCRIACMWSYHIVASFGLVVSCVVAESCIPHV